MQIGENIRELRKQYRWTQEQLAGMIGTGKNYLASIERGERNPSEKLLSKIAEAFAVPEKRLRYGEDEKEEPPANDLGRLAESEVRKLFSMARDDNERLALSGDLFRFLAERRREMDKD